MTITQAIRTFNRGDRYATLDEIIQACGGPVAQTLAMVDELASRGIIRLHPYTGAPASEPKNLIRRANGTRLYYVSMYDVTGGITNDVPMA